MDRRSVYALAVALLVATATDSQAQGYYLVRIPVPKGANSIVNVVGLDANGDAAGNVLIGSQNVPVRWTAPGPVVLPDVGTGPRADGQSYSANGVNTVGGVAGVGVDSTGTSVGIYWDPSGHPYPLASANLINGVSDVGVAVGQAPSSDSDIGFAATWNGTVGQPSLLPQPPVPVCTPQVFPKLCYSAAQAISPSGKFIVGTSGIETNNSGEDGALWIDGALATVFGWQVYGNAVNDSGVVAGSYDTGLPPLSMAGGVYHAFIWKSGKLTDLGSLPGSTATNTFFSSASAINASGVIVGNSESTDPSNSHAVIWRDGKIADLQTALASRLPAHTTIFSADAITNDGQILLSASDNSTGARSWFIAKPIVPTHITVSSNINPSSYGQQIHLVARIAATSGPTPQGLVSWYDNGKLVGSARVTTVGTASWGPSTLAPGTHNVIAKYAEYDPDGPSASPVFKQTVKQTTTRTAIFASANPVTHGTLFTLTATVVPAYGTITGSVTFKSGATTLGTAALNSHTKQARITVSIRNAGKYTVIAAYGGTSNFLPSASAPLALTVK